MVVLAGLRDYRDTPSTPVSDQDGDAFGSGPRSGRASVAAGPRLGALDEALAPRGRPIDAQRRRAAEAGSSAGVAGRSAKRAIRSRTRLLADEAVGPAIKMRGLSQSGDSPQLAPELRRRSRRASRDGAGHRRRRTRRARAAGAMSRLQSLRSLRSVRDPIARASATLSRPHSCPTRSRRTVTGSSATICERSRKPFAPLGSTVTWNSGASNSSEVIGQTMRDACVSGTASV